MKTLTTSIILLLSACVLSAQNASLIQGKSRIIVKSMSEITENVSEMAEETDNAMPRLRQIKEQMDAHTAKSKDPDLSEDERFVHNANALKARADMLVDYRKMVVANQARFEAIDASIGKMKNAADAMNGDTPENRMQLEQTSLLVEATLQSESKLADMVAGIPLGSVSDETLDNYDFTAQINAQAEKIAKHRREAFTGRDYSTRLDRLREKVTQRRHQLAMIDEIIDGSLDSARQVTGNNMIVVALRDMDKAFDKIATLDDPLSIKFLEPGYESQLLLEPGSGMNATTGTGSGSSNRPRGMRTTADFR